MAIWDELFPGINDPKEIKEAINLIENLDKSYLDFINGAKKTRSEYKKAVGEIIKTTNDLNRSVQNLNPASQENRNQIAQISKAADIASASYKKNNERVKQLEGSIKVLTKEQDNFNKKSKETLRINREREKLVRKLNGLTKEQAREQAVLRARIAEKNKELKREAQETLGLVSVYDKQVAKMRQLSKEYRSLVVSGKANTDQARKMKAEHDKLRATILKADASVGVFTKRIGQSSAGLRTFVSVGRQVGAALGFTGIIFAVIGALRNAINITKVYEKRNAELAGVLGVTRKETVQLQKNSQDLGATTAKTATEVTELQIAYARLGFTQREILEVTAATINGSIALNAELDETALLVGAVVRAFDDLDSSDADLILDQITIATQKSSNNFETLSTSLPKVAGAANAMGISLREVLAQLSVAQDATQDASIAGTSLRNIYLKLAETGLTLDEALDKIQNSQNKVNTAVELFDKRSAITALALANNRTRTAELTEALDEQGVALRVAKENLDTLSGSMDLAGSAWEGLTLSINERSGIISTAFRGVVDSFTGFLTVLRAANDETIPWGEAISALRDPLLFGFTLAKINAAEAAERSAELARQTKIAEEAQKLYNLGIQNGRDTWDALQDLEPERLLAGMADKKEILLEVQRLYNEALREEVETELQARPGIIKSLQEEIKLLREKKALATSEDEIAALNQEINMRENELQRLNKLGLEIPERLKKKNVEVQKAIIKTPEIVATATTKSLSEIEKAQLKARVAIFNTQEFIRKAFEEGLQVATDLFVGINNLFNAGEEARIEANERRIEELEIQRQRELDIAGDNVDAQIAINERFDRERQRLEEDGRRRKQRIARNDKIAAIAQATIDTAAGVSKALAQGGFVLGIPWAAIVGALGAIQIATIAATPIPQFAEGTDSAPGGLAIVGEKGRELVMEPGGKAYLTGDKAELRDIPEGSQILTNAITENILRNSSKEKDVNAEAAERVKVGLRKEKEEIVRKQFKMNMEKLSHEIREGFNDAVSNIPVTENKFGKRGLRRDVRKGGTTYRDVQDENRLM